MKFNELLGLELREAENLLKDKGIQYIVKKTMGYKDIGILTVPRVIMVEEKENNIELIITYFSNSLN